MVESNGSSGGGVRCYGTRATANPRLFNWLVDLRGDVGKKLVFEALFTFVHRQGSQYSREKIKTNASQVLAMHIDVTTPLR